MRRLNVSQENGVTSVVKAMHSMPREPPVAAHAYTWNQPKDSRQQNDRLLHAHRSEPLNQMEING